MPGSDTASAFSRLGYLTALIAIVCAVSSCKSSQADTTTRSPKPLEVRYYLALPSLFSEQFITNAELLPYEQVDITSEVSAKVVSIHFEEGQRKRKGDVLVQLDAREAIARMHSLEAQLEQAEKSYHRSESLLNTGGVSAEEFETAKSRYQQLKAELMAAKVMVERHTIRAPFDGVAGMRDFSPGSYVSNQQMLLHFWQISPLKVEIDIPERLSGYVRVGDAIKIFSDYSADTLTAVVYATDPIIDKTLRSNKIRARIIGNSSHLLPGTYVKAAIDIRSQSHVLKVPAECVVPQLGKQIIYVVDSGLTKSRVVELGRRGAVFVEVLKGLYPGDTVIASGILQVRPGTPVLATKPISIEQ